MSSPHPIPSRKTRRPELSSSYTASLPSASPIAQEIIASDLADCSDDDVGEEFEGSEADLEPDHGPRLYRQPRGVAIGQRRSSLLPEQDEAVMTRPERVRSRNEERSLLRDNHLLPPKHNVNENQSVFTRLYKWMFSTKVRRSHEEDDAPSANGTATETSPLLAGEVAADDILCPEDLDQQWDAAVASRRIKTTWQREAKTIAVYARSLVMTFLLQYSINITSIFAVGHIGKDELGAISLASMTANITCYGIFQGLATSLDTLCAQAYGSGHKHLVGLQLQRAVIFLWIAAIPIATVWIFSGEILKAIIPETRSAELAGLYLRIVTFGIPGYAAFEGGKRFVQAQGLFYATTAVLVIAAPFNIFCNWLFVWHFEWGFIGAPIAVALTQLLMPILLLLFVIFIDGSQCWGGFSKRAFANWGPMVKLSVPGMVMIEAEWLAFELTTLMTSQMGSSYLAAQSILITVTTTTFYIPFAVSIACSTRVANLIGAKLAEAAKNSAKVAVYCAFIIGLFNMMVLIALRHQLPLLFTDDEEVISITASALSFCAILQLFDSLATAAHGLLRGIGKQSFGGYANLASYWLVAVPLGLALAFPLDWKLEGLWIGFTGGLIVVAIVEYWYIYVSDWEMAVREAADRASAG